MGHAMAGPLANPRHERFAQVLAYGLAQSPRWTQAKAYETAGYKPSDRNVADAAASRLLRKVKPILGRVHELQAQALRKKKITVESIVEELEEARDIAKQGNQANAMVAASTGKAKILGLVVDRTEQGKPGDFAQANDQANVAKMLLRNAGMDESEVSEVACAEALEALGHFNERIAAIVQGARMTGTQAS